MKGTNMKQDLWIQKTHLFSKNQYRESKIEPNKTVAEYSQWGAEEISERQKALCKAALEIWKKLAVIVQFIKA